jgi:uncharacterized protein YeaO (DUF488 family)
MIKIKRAYEPASNDDGYRVLVDRLWPRGIKKSDLVLNEWAKELAPSADLRKDFGHDPAHWQDFRTKYRKELRVPAARKTIERLAKRAQNLSVTLVYAARDEKHNNAVVLKGLLDEMIKEASPRARAHKKAA